MDSRLIYSIINSIKHKINWENKSNDEWFYIGEEGEVNEELVYKVLVEQFDDDSLLLVLGRDSSKKIQQKDFHVEIIEKIGKVDFIISDEKFRQFLEFNKIGILRIGRINKTK